MKIKKYTVCGQEFESYNGREVCSDECRKVARKEILHKNNKWYYENRKKGWN